MKIVFFGNADFGRNALISLIESHHEIVGIVTNNDVKSGRYQKLTPTPIKEIALVQNLNLIEQNDIKDESFIKKLSTLDADIFIVIAYKILPRAIYTLPKFGSINVHASLLPQHKGPSPIQQSIINGDNTTGLSSFFIDDSIDGGNLIFQKKISISNSDNFGTLWEKLSELSRSFIIKTLDLIMSNKRDILFDENTPESYAEKIKKEHLVVDWSEDATLIHNKIRAFSPHPCMCTFLENKRIKIHQTKPVYSINEKSLNTGEFYINKNQIIVRCGENYLEILELQPESKKKLSANEFLNGYFKSIKKYKFGNRF